MNIMRHWLAVLSAILVFSPAIALADPAEMATVTLTGPDLSVELTADSLAALPPAELSETRRTGDGEVRYRYKGVLLWDVIAAQTDLDDDVKQSLRHVVQAIAEDGHQVAFGIGEIAPGFGNAPIMLAYQIDGQPIEGGMQMVAPGDQRGARFVKGVTVLEIR